MTSISLRICFCVKNEPGISTAPWAPSRVDMCALQIFIINIIIITTYTIGTTEAVSEMTALATAISLFPPKLKNTRSQKRLMWTRPYVLVEICYLHKVCQPAITQSTALNSKWAHTQLAWRSDVMLWGSWITPDTGHAAAMFPPEIQLWPWLVASVWASKRDVRSSAQRIQWNPLNGTPGACLYRWQDKDWWPV